MRRCLHRTIQLVLLVGIVLAVPHRLHAEPPEVPLLVPGSDFIEQINDDNRGKITTFIEIAFVITILSLAPSILILTTCFTRIIVVFSFLRRGMATQQLPPDQIVMGLGLFLSFMVMAPTWQRVWDEAIVPYLASESEKDVTGKSIRIDGREALRRAKRPIKTFMLNQMTRNDYADLALMAEISGAGIPEGGYRSYDEIPILTVIPAFVLSELKISFQMGFLIYLPFLIIDMVVASVLMSMGMLMLPPILISLPFKILLFVLGDGWQLLTYGLVQSFVTT